MKEIRIHITDQDYVALKDEANRLGISLKLLLHNRAIGIDSENTPFNLAKQLSDEISFCRKDINRIIQRETRSEYGLYEDDVIRLEMAMRAIEGVVANFISEVLRQVKHNGNANI